MAIFITTAVKTSNPTRWRSVRISMLQAVLGFLSYIDQFGCLLELETLSLSTPFSLLATASFDFLCVSSDWWI
jgi:hypothetical protein